MESDEWSIVLPRSFYSVFGESRITSEQIGGTIKLKFDPSLAGVVSLCHGIRFSVESREDEEKSGQIDSNRAIHDNRTIQQGGKAGIKIEGRAGRVLGRSLYDTMLSCRGGCPCSCDRHYDVSRRDAYVRVILDPHDNRRDNSVIIPPSNIVRPFLRFISSLSLSLFSSLFTPFTPPILIPYRRFFVADIVADIVLHVSFSRFLHVRRVSNFFRREKKAERRP